MAGRNGETGESPVLSPQLYCQWSVELSTDQRHSQVARLEQVSSLRGKGWELVGRSLASQAFSTRCDRKCDITGFFRSYLTHRLPELEG